METIRTLASCIGVTGEVSILRDFLGFLRGRVPPDPSGANSRVSLLQQARLLRGRHFHLNVIAIGGDNFVDTNNIQVDYSIYRSRAIYQQVGVGVGRVQHYIVNRANAGGLDAPVTEDNLSTIGHRWVVNNDALDVAVPLSMTVPSKGGRILGLSPEPGPCETKDSKDMNGSVVGLFGSEQTARSFAHEIGHNLRLGHENGTPSNLMAQTSAVRKAGLSVRSAQKLTAAQGDTIKEHCLMKQGCG